MDKIVVRGDDASQIPPPHELLTPPGTPEFIPLRTADGEDGGKLRAAPASASAPGLPHSLEHEEELDGCMCDLALEAAEAVSDQELPPATGGLQRAPAIRAEAGDSEEAEATTDERLPMARGGVASWHSH